MKQPEVEPEVEPEAASPSTLRRESIRKRKPKILKFPDEIIETTKDSPFQIDLEVLPVIFGYKI